VFDSLIPLADVPMTTWCVARKRVFKDWETCLLAVEAFINKGGR
jgi:hypothetical protein